MMIFFREKARVITWSIIIFFGATLFSTSFFLGGNSGASPERQNTLASIQNAPALIDGNPIDNYRFQNYYNQSMSQIDLDKMGGRLAPELMELVLYNSAIETIKDMILVDRAKAESISVSKQAFKASLSSAIIQSGLQSKKALKERLKKSGFSYEAYTTFLNDQLILNQFIKARHDQVVVTDQDVDNRYIRVKVRHILLADTGDTDNLELMAQNVYDQLSTKAISFSDAVARFSSDSQTIASGGDMGWIGFGQVAAPIEEVIYELPVGTISRPIKTGYGFHIVEVTDRDDSQMPTDIDYDTEKAAILDFKKRRVIAEMIQPYFVKSGYLKFQWPLIKAHHAKRSGDIETALNAYQLLISTDAFSPVPHYLMAQLYLTNNDISEAVSEIEKATVKVDINPVQSFPELYVLSGEIYSKNRDYAKANASYQRAYEGAKTDNLAVLNELKRVLSKGNTVALLTDVNDAIKEIDRQKREAAAQKKLELEASMVEGLEVEMSEGEFDGVSSPD